MEEEQATENAQPGSLPPNDVDNRSSQPDPICSNHGGIESQNETSEEVRGILEVIASTGKFWHQWDNLKNMLSFQLKQVLSEYPEGRMNTDQQNSILGETYPDLVKRLDEALLSFIEGPPFTLQRLCEILLEARIIYPDLSKLALALEKNLFVASTLTICTDPYMPEVTQKQDEPEKGGEKYPSPVENGVIDRDETMAEAEAADVHDDMTADMETLQEVVGSSETDSAPTCDS